MGLLWLDYENEFRELVEEAYRAEQADSSQCFRELTRRVERILRRDTRYNVDFLYTAYTLHDDKVMTQYAVWLYELMAGILKERSTAELERYVVNHLGYIAQAVDVAVSPDKRRELKRLIRVAQDAVRAHVANLGQEGAYAPGRFEAQVQRYLDALLSRDTRKALGLIQEFCDEGLSVNDVYVEVLAESMRRIGELWHTGQISVDTEHYCTSTTQTAMAQMYQQIFSSPRKGRSIVVACPGAELHEMGARMMADIFENDGWDTVFLGAAVPLEYVMSSIEESKPDVLALSVTMPQHLIECAELVQAVRAEHPEVLIAVGGRAFESTERLWTSWDVDFHADDARELLHAANEAIDARCAAGAAATGR